MKKVNWGNVFSLLAFLIALLSWLFALNVKHQAIKIYQDLSSAIQVNQECVSGIQHRERTVFYILRDLEKQIEDPMRHVAEIRLGYKVIFKDGKIISVAEAGYPYPKEAHNEKIN